MYGESRTMAGYQASTHTGESTSGRSCMIARNPGTGRTRSTTDAPTHVQFSISELDRGKIALCHELRAAMRRLVTSHCGEYLSAVLLRIISRDHDLNVVGNKYREGVVGEALP